MPFTVLHSLANILPHIAGREEFRVLDRGEYAVVDYTQVLPNSYPPGDGIKAAVRRECRGLKFDADGRLIARPLHKFFNVNERPETAVEALPWDRPHLITDNLDGSMIHACRLGGELVLMSRGGRSDVARQAEVFLQNAAGHRALMEQAVDAGRTPIFEWTSPQQPIVIDYERDNLTLLAIRDVTCGEYTSPDELAMLAEAHGVPLVEARRVDAADPDAFIQHTRQLTGREGYVVWFDNGPVVKLKAEDYVRRHRAGAALAWEKDVIAALLDGTLNDHLPLLPERQREAMRQFSGEFWRKLDEQIKRWQATVGHALAAGLTAKAFAAQITGEPADAKPVLFGLFRGRDGRTFVVEHLRRQCGSTRRLDRHRHWWGGGRWRDHLRSIDDD
jgi:RNA ligase